MASRANYGRVRSVLFALRERDDTQLQIIVSASALLYRFGEVSRLIEEDG